MKNLQKGKDIGLGGTPSLLVSSVSNTLSAKVSEHWTSSSDSFLNGQWIYKSSKRMALVDFRLSELSI